MPRALLFIAVATLTLSTFAADKDASAQALAELQLWLKKPVAERAGVGEQPFAKTPLTKDDAEAARAALWNDHLAQLRDTRKAEMDAKLIELDGKKMKFEIVRFGAADKIPDGGRSLFISLHGGGNAAPPVNESQWKNQIALGRAYKPQEGLYIAPRAPTDTWNLWHEAHIDKLFARLIENCIALENVNPNRVYVLGYSAGGDGVYQLAPRMSDFWAAASMMAGHPNETQPDGLRNVPFALQVGANDAPYKRNTIAAEWGKKLDELKKSDPKGYEHFVEVHAGKGHWMDLEDKKAIPWMEKFTRNPLPEKIIWLQDDVTHTSFYWLSVPKDQPQAKHKVVAERAGQSITLESKDVKKISVLLNDQIANLDEPITIKIGEKEEKKTAVRTIETLWKTLQDRRDPDLMFSAEINAQ